MYKNILGPYAYIVNMASSAADAASLLLRGDHCKLTLKKKKKENNTHNAKMQPPVYNKRK